MTHAVIFAHTPPPHHGQSYMVAVLLAELRARPGAVRCWHVDARLSDDLGQIGRPGAGKILRLLRFCARAWWLRGRRGARTFYYVPAPGKRAAVYRDWIVMALCRPFFPRLVLHWHAVGLGEWLRMRARPWERWLTLRLLGGADMSVALARYALADQEIFRPRRVCVVPNGIADPCPDFTENVLPARWRRARERRAALQAPAGEGRATDKAPAAAPFSCRALFLAHCTREKGLYDALEAVALVNGALRAERREATLRLTVAGQFLSDAEREAFLLAAARFGPDAPVDCVGFAAGEEKARWFRESDVFLFPTYYPNEAMPVTLIEALAHGLTVVATRWRGIPEMLPAAGCWLTEPRRPAETAAALREALLAEDAAPLRRHYEDNFQLARFGERMVAAFAAADEPTVTAAPAPAATAAERGPGAANG